MIYSYLLVCVMVAACLGQEEGYRAEGPAPNYNFNDQAAVEAPRPPFLNLPSNDNPQYASPNGGQVHTQVFHLPDGSITTLQIPQFN